MFGASTISRSSVELCAVITVFGNASDYVPSVVTKRKALALYVWSTVIIFLTLMGLLREGSWGF